MSEPDAVPLPREGEVFFDVRGEARSMRLSWYADSKVAVFSIWQGSRCTGTFRLPFVDLARMVQTLQSGPPVPAHQPPAYQSPAQRDGYQADPVIQASLPGAGPGYAAATAAFDSGPDHGYQYGQDRRHDYGAGPANPAYDAPAAHQDFGAAGSYQSDQGYSAGQDYGGGQNYDAGRYGPGHDYATGTGYDAGQDYGARPYARPGLAATPAFGTDRPYGGDPYQPNDPYSRSEPYRGSEQYRPAERFSQGEQFSQGEPYRTSRHGADQPRHDRSDYDSPNYGDLPPYRDQRTVAAEPVAPQRAPDWPLPAAPTQPKPGPDSDSVPDTAMMSFPSVPVRNGPSGYR
jgi:hypothetical protein